MKKRCYILFLALILCVACQNESSTVREKEARLEDAPKTVRLVAFGDFMLHRPQINAAKTPEGYDFTHVFRYVEPFIQGADIAMINLETTLTDGNKGYSTFPVFSSPKEVARDFKTVGFDVICTANNHAYDKLSSGVDATFTYLKEAGVDVVGTRIEQSPPLIKDVNGIKIGFLAYTYGLNGFDNTLAKSEKPYAVSVFSKDIVAQEMAYLREREVDIVICYMHWGEEYYNEATATQKEQAKYLADQGVALILGSHPHVPQGIENIATKEGITFVAYSMGNFASNQRREYLNNRRVESGQMILSEITKEGDRTRISGFEPVALYVDKFYADKLYYEVLPAQMILDKEVPLQRLEQVKSRLEEVVDDHSERINSDLILRIQERK